MENEKVEKYKDFLGSQKFLKSEKFSQASLVFSHFEVAFLLMDSIGDFSYEFLQNTLFHVSKFRWYACIFTWFEI